MTARLILQEYGDSIPVPRELITPANLEEANQKWSQILDLPSAPFNYSVSADKIYIRAIGIAGVIRVGKLDIEVAPKFLIGENPQWRSVFWKILQDTADSSFDLSSTSAAIGADDGFVDLLASMFIGSYFSGSSRGMPRTYASVSGTGFVLKGSFDYSRIAEFMHRPWEVPFVSDELTENTPLARLIKWAAKQLMGLVVDSDRARALKSIIEELAHVDRNVPHIIDARRIFVGAQHQALTMAKEIAILLLEGSGLTHDAGEFLMPGFLWRSNTVYENFIFALCVEAGRKRNLSVSKSVHHFGQVVRGTGLTLTTIPDVVFRDANGNVHAIADAKYKRFSYEGKPKPADTYQMLAGGLVLNCNHLGLLYPASIDVSPTTWKVESTYGDGSLFLSAIHIDLMQLAHENGRLNLVSQIVDWLDIASPRPYSQSS